MLITLSSTTAKGWPPLLVSAIALKIAADAVLIHKLRSCWPSLRALALIPFEDLLVAAIWAVGFFRRTIVWLGNVMRIASGSVLFSVDGFGPVRGRHRTERVET